MRVSEVVAELEKLAPPSLAAGWDNVGLLVGDADEEVRKVLLCIDLTEPVLAEAARTGARMVMAYHPVIFKPIGRLTAQAAPAAYKAARAGLAVYSMHTALDAAVGGTNDALADLLGLTNRRPLEPSVGRDNCKIVTFAPPDDLSRVAEAAFAAGAGRIGNYYDCAFFAHGIGSFCGGEGSHPSIGLAGRHEATEEMRLEIVAPRNRAAAVCEAIRATHSYEAPVVDVYPLEDVPPGCGMGRIGRLARPTSAPALITRLKRATGLGNITVALARGGGPNRARPALTGLAKVTTAACAAGACGDLYKAAVAGGATFLLTGEMRHHDALAATRAGLTVACLGHSNSERIALAGLAKRLSEMAPRLTVAVSQADRDPFAVV
ncbi:MAG: Nif3-like dinuclear metal center hexameric protein [Phycisphaerae bacterium]